MILTQVTMSQWKANLSLSPPCQVSLVWSKYKSPSGALSTFSRGPVPARTCALLPSLLLPSWSIDGMAGDLAAILEYEAN